MLGASALLLALALMVVRFLQLSWPVWKAHGLGWVVGTHWAPAEGIFGALPFVYGTVITSVIALVIGTPIALGTALFVSEIAPAKIRRPISDLIDLLAAVPSVIYGLWGIIVVLPLLQPVEQFLADSLGRVIPIFAGPPSGTSFFAAGVVLAIMIVPTISAVTREVFVTVPQDVREAAFALGATRWEMIRYGVLPPARAGIVGAVILGLGRALGETVAVLLLIGQIPSISKSIFSGGYSMASVIANEFGQSQEPLHLQALIAIGLVLFVVTVLMNIFARLLVGKAARSRA
ncbi:MAG: phosphate transport system permease protein [Actinomycetota bacterium]|nr:phosphate transport system permease protein [Actinomycetota bacterium]